MSNLTHVDGTGAARLYRPVSPASLLASKMSGGWPGARAGTDFFGKSMRAAVQSTPFGKWSRS